MNPRDAARAPSTQLLEEAAEWLVTFNFETPDAGQRQAFARWLEQSEAHRAAWTRAERLYGTFETVPAAIGRQALTPAGFQGLSRRRALRLLSALLVAAPAGWMALRTPSFERLLADARTGVGERKTLVLIDGSQVVLNTASALDIRFDERQRRLHLRQGEVLVTTHPDTVVPRRPFLVASDQGDIEALGTRFSVRQEDGVCQVAVFAQQVEIRPLTGTPVRLRAGQQAGFTAASVQPVTAVDDTASLWEQGMLVARDRRLAEVLAELARYRPGVLHCAPEVAELRVSGALSLTDTDQALTVLARTLPIRVTWRTRYWATIVAR